MANSLARPGGNITGTSLFSTELDGKRQEILIEALPGLRHMAALADSKTTAALRLRSLQDAARARGIELSVHQIAKPDEIPTALQAAKACGAAAMNVLSSPVLYGNRSALPSRSQDLGAVKHVGGREKRERYLIVAAPAMHTTSSCEPVAPEQPIAPMILSFSIRGIPPREATISSIVVR
jgi:hypothetical protein